MPLVRIGLTKDVLAGRVRIGCQAVCGARIGTANVPVSDEAGIEGLGALVNSVGVEV